MYTLNYKTALLFSAIISSLMEVMFFIIVFFSESISFSEKMENQIVYSLIDFFFNFLMAFLLYMLNFKLLKTQITPIKCIILILISLLVVALILSYIFSIVQLLIRDIFFSPDMFPPPEIHPGLPHDRGGNMFHESPIFINKFIIGSLFRNLSISIFVALSSQVLYISNLQSIMAIENEKLQAENMRTRFMALKNQVDPHFLFNSLNTLSSLIKTDAEKAQEYVQQLSYVFRYTLQNKEIISLEEELKSTMAYCYLMQIRYGDNLHFVNNIDEKYAQYLIIPLSLQTLVENAIKHNVVSNKQPLTITFSTSDDETITVSNPIQPKKEPESGENIGLSNLSERYRFIRRKEITIRNNGKTFEVEIPLIS